MARRPINNDAGNIHTNNDIIAKPKPPRLYPINNKVCVDVAPGNI